ncbi:MAG: efflux RND transporter periplasmic adaptor subunit [Deltaproteobacteria bacterium]|nr:efflux RND transporter periplasmic adaptor subunit [Deltaproteobacteria bacterium]
MNQTTGKSKLLRLIWGLFPWAIVLCIAIFIFSLYQDIRTERSRLEKAKQEAIRKDTPSVRVITLTVIPRRLEDTIKLPGYVEPAEELWVKTEVSGQVLQVLVKEGALITRGQVIAQLDDRDYRSRLSRIEANHRLAKLEYDRIYSLDKKKITAASRLDEIEARLNDVSAQQDEAELALSRTRILAPIEGQVNEIIARQGSFLGVGDPVAQILRLSDVKVTVGIPESDVAFFLDLNEATVIIDALGKRRVTGKKVFLSRQPRNLARLFDLELEIPNTDGHILPSMFARVELIRAVHEKALVIPLYAVINQGDEQFVYIENDGSAKKTPVVMGQLVDWQVHITSGISANDKVIVVGHRLLNDGQPIEVIKNVSDVREILAL